MLVGSIISKLTNWLTKPSIATPRRAFTLVELLVVVGIISVLASTVVVNLNRSRARARDSKRKADLLSIQGALEIYYASNRSYPTTGGAWFGEPSNHGSRCYVDGCNPGPYIPGLAPTFMSVLPSDPTKGKPSASAVAAVPGCTTGEAGYMYNSNGSDYKVLAHCTIESTPASSDPVYDPVRPAHAFAVYSGGGAAF